MKFASSLVLLVAFAATLRAQSANVQTVLSNYAAFGRGDIPAILATLAPDCRWTHPGNAAIIPFAGTFVGAEEIAGKFFAAIPTAIQILVFEPSIVREDGSTVVTSVKIKGKGIASGREYENIAEMRWTFGDDGKVARYETIFDPTGLEWVLSN